MNSEFLGKIKESVLAVIPITVVIVVVNFAVTPMSAYNLAAFIAGALLLVIGKVFYSVGADIAVEPMGSYIGAQITKTKKPLLIFAVCFVIGVMVTIAEPDITVLASQVPNISNAVLVITVAVGVGLFMIIALLRTVFKVNIRYVLLIFYAAVFVLAAFADKQFIPLAFDSGGVTTGPITVPFIMALGIGITAVFGGDRSEDGSFGMIGICSIGPIIAVLILGLVYRPEAVSTGEELIKYTSVREVFVSMLRSLPHYLKEVGIALLPVCAFFYLVVLFTKKLSKIGLLRITVGVIYTYVGLAIFLVGINIGFMPAGMYIGGTLASCEKWFLVPVGIFVGAFIVLAEPAVHVLNKQVEELTDGIISRRVMLASLAVSMSLAVALSMIRVITGISIWFLILPGYAIALGLSFFADKTFTAVAFDSGGVASGPMTATFLLPFAMGACKALGGNIFTDAFGIVAMVAMMPLITIQVLGAVFKIKKSVKAGCADKKAAELLATEGNVIELIGFTDDKNIVANKNEKRRKNEKIERY